MRRPVQFLLLALACAAGAAALAQDPPEGTPVPVEDEARPATTGDAWIDARLQDMDGYAARWRDAFVDEIVRYLEAPRPLVEEALAEAGMRPGDVFYACALARASGRSCRSLVDAWAQDASGGWPGVAARLELGADAKLNARIREDIVASYRRWDRPIEDPPARSR